MFWILLFSHWVCYTKSHISDLPRVKTLSYYPIIVLQIGWLNNRSPTFIVLVIKLSASAADWKRQGSEKVVLLICVWLLRGSDWHQTKCIHDVEERWPRCCGGKRSFGPAHHETEEGMEKVGKTEWKELPALLLMCLFSEKMQSQLHKHHASTEWQRVLYTESLCSREGAREKQRLRERAKRCRVWQ